MAPLESVYLTSSRPVIILHTYLSTVIIHSRRSTM